MNESKFNRHDVGAASRRELLPSSLLLIGPEQELAAGRRSHDISYGGRLTPLAGATR